MTRCDGACKVPRKWYRGRRLCPKCSEGGKPVEGCVICDRSALKSAAKVVSKRVTASTTGGYRQNGNYGTDGWESHGGGCK